MVGPSFQSVWVCAAVLAGAGCVLDDVPLAGLSCECAPGWGCDRERNVCVEGLVEEEIVCGRAGVSAGTVLISNLTRVWVTPNQVRLEWEAEGLDDLREYRLDVASAPEDLVFGTGDRTVDADENPEFDRPRLLGAQDDVLRTTLRGLEPDTEYAVRLVAEDVGGGFSCSDVLVVQTNPSPRVTMRTLIDEQELLQAPATRPTCASRSIDPPSSRFGEAHYAHTIECRVVCPLVNGVPAESCDESMIFSRSLCPPNGDDADVGLTCYENVRFRGFEEALTMSVGQFEDAYVEVWIAIVQPDNANGSLPPTGGWGEMGIRYEGDGVGDGRTYAGFRNTTFVADAGYHRYQVPLSELSPRLPVSEDGLELVVNGVRMGTQFSHGTVVRMDAASINW
ncbi:MAG: hypothetical protein AAF411_01500 [Myxococcota bacterium]